MNPTEIQRLIELLESLETRLQTTGKSSGELKSALSTLSTGFKEALASGGVVQDIGKIEQAFSRLPQIFKTGIAGSVGDIRLLTGEFEKILGLITTIKSTTQVAPTNAAAALNRAIDADYIPQYQPQTTKSVSAPSSGSFEDYSLEVQVKGSLLALEKQLNAERTKSRQFVAPDAGTWEDLQVKNQVARAVLILEGQINAEVVKNAQNQQKVTQSLKERFKALSDISIAERRTAAPRSDVPSTFVADPDKAETLARNYEKLAGIFPGGIKQVEAFEQSIESMGQSLGGRVETFRDAASGVERFRIASRDASGTLVKLEGSVNSSGNAVFDSTGKFRNFANTIARNIAEVAKWTIAVRLIYGSIDQLNQLVQTAIENQTRLAQITIVLGNAQRSVNTIFNDAASIARDTGSSIEGILDSYGNALRVTSGITNETDRFAQANRLLADSLTLSKLGALDQKEAMDLLIASLAQTNSEISDGTSLIDKWVATSNNAGVTLEDLATAYSITAGAAQDAGIKVGGANDELSSLIAVIAESFPYEGRELGNRVRALISGVTETGRQDVLRSFGISPKDVEGQLRPFLDIYKELAALLQSGAITEVDIGKFAGGNARERNIIIEFLKSLNRAQEIQESTADSAGAANAALGKQLETVETAVNRLGVAFASLAQTLGTDGGILEGVTSIVNMFTSLVGVIEDVVQLTGKAGPALALLLGANALGARGFGIEGGFAGALSRSVATGLGRRPQPDLLQRTLPGFNPQLEQPAAKAATVFSTSVGNVLPGLIASGITASLLEEGNRLEGFFAGVVGAGIGAAMGGGPGALIGSQIAIAIVEAIRNAFDSSNFGTEVGQAYLEAAKQARIRIDLELGVTPETVKDAENQLSQLITDFQPQGIKGWLSSLLDIGYAPYYQQFDLLKDLGVDGDAGDVLGLDETRQLALALSNGLDVDKANQLLATIRAAKEEQAGLTKGVKDFYEEVSNVSNVFRGPLLGSISDIQAELEQGFFSEQISADEFFSLTEKLREIPNVVDTVFGSFGEALIKNESDVNNTQEAYEELFDFILRAGPAVVSRILELTVGLDPTNIEDYTERYREFINLLNNAPRRDFYDPTSSLEIPVTIDISELEEGQTDRVMQEYIARLSAYKQALIDSLKITPAEAQEIIESLEKNVIFEMADRFEAATERIVPSIFGDAQRAVTRSGSSARQSVGFQQIDLPSTAYGEIERLMNYFATELGKLGYQPQKTSTILEFEDDVIQVKDVDGQLLRLALNELIEVNRDQLEGIYNLPTDASFYVPFTGYKLGFGQDGEGGSGSPSVIDVAGSDRIQSAAGTFSSAVDRFAQAITAIEKAKSSIGTPKEGGSSWTAETAVQAIAAGLQQGHLGISTRTQQGSQGSPYDVQAIQSLGDTIGRAIRRETYDRDISGKLKGGAGTSDTSKLTEQLASINQNILSALNFNKADKIQPVDLRVQLQSVSQLTLDGRLIAQVVKQHLYQDLIRFQGSGGGATVRYVV